MTKILFVCLGNICRSPSAEGVFRKKVQNRRLENRYVIDSAGTANYHEGEMADPRSINHAAQRGYNLSSHRARQITPEDFMNFDWVIAMDKNNYEGLKAIAPTHLKGKIHLMCSFVKDWNPLPVYQEIPDPYYGGKQEFELVLDLLEVSTEKLLDYLEGS
ncbi:MAG: low molecular weight protein-tyrosine-phosphatase [Chloroherpetonaceae bacterium]|nr:low molecular weight protein-tyrosine-phosphatase [Chloroherpetonaceae bacterium]